MIRSRAVFFAILAHSCLSPAVAQEKPAGKIDFQRVKIDAAFRSEGVALGDFNKDGKQDIAAGYVWYESPDWKMHVTGDKAPEYDPHNYSNSFQTFADDVNGDGWADLLVVDFPGKETWVLENPQGSDTPWKKYALVPCTNNESVQFVDIDGDKKLDLLFAFSTDPKNSDAADRRMAYSSRKSGDPRTWAAFSISAEGAPGTTRYAHGLGLGDINGDQRPDILVPQGWWEAPAKLPAQDGPWTFHPAKLGENCAQMYVYDLDGDGDNDVLSSSAHGLGIWWHEQFPDGKWQTHEIDKSFSQTHALCLADINGDGLPDFVTGKRWWAHGPKGDVGPDQPAVLCWFELSRQGGRPVWTKHQVDHDSGVGTQFEVADINGDGLLDIATSNKKGTQCFLQVRK
jgi:hypothetical protein